MWAALSGHAAAIAALVAAVAEVEATSNDCWTALMHAEARKHDPKTRGAASRGDAMHVM